MKSIRYGLTQNQWRKKYDEEGKEMKKERKRREKKCNLDLNSVPLGFEESI